MKGHEKAETPHFCGVSARMGAEEFEPSKHKPSDIQSFAGSGFPRENRALPGMWGAERGASTRSVRVRPRRLTDLLPQDAGDASRASYRPPLPRTYGTFRARCRLLPTPT